ncbi:hypothetical protein E0Z10_g889 [Xylaria hypoxylon]|uniref:Uncharacterized protein n=1 Tax=Xylaria hypoxylon TaxID=37992 RepID=A0A4Z0YVC0_9PEZI|nr:hypothetical protein E0Z10_g889 [Xylaria hypoxylon]
MATSEVLIDLEAVAAEIVTGIFTEGGGGDASQVPKKLLELGRQVIDDCLKAYNQKYYDLFKLYTKTKIDYTDMKTSLDKQIGDYKDQVEECKASKTEEINNASLFWKQQRDDVTKRADLERESMEKERQELEKKKQQAKAEVDRYKREAQDAAEIQAEAEKAFTEERETNQRLQDTNNSFERAIGELRAESKSWEKEAHDTATLREGSDAALTECQIRAGAIKQRNQELQRELKKLKPQLENAQHTVNDQEKKLQNCEQQLKDTKEKLHSLQPDTPTRGTPSNAGSPVKGGLLSGLRGSTSPSSSGGRGRVSSQSSGVRDETTLDDTVQDSDFDSQNSTSEELEKEKERYQQLEAAIESDYVPRVDHEQAVADKTKELEDIKAERDNVQKAQANCQTALKKLQEDLAKKQEEDKTAKKDSAKVRELEAEIAAYEAQAETHRDNDARQRDRIRDLERQLKTSKETIANLEKKSKVTKERIAELEKRERQQQTTIATQQTKIAELKNRPDTTSAGAQPDDKDREIKRLTGDLERAQNDLMAARKEADDTNTELQRERETLSQFEQRYEELQQLLETTEEERTNFELRRDALERLVLQHQEVENQLMRELHDSEENRANLRQAIETMLQPTYSTEGIQGVLTRQVLDLIDLRRATFNFQEQLIPMAQAAANEYRDITGEGFVVEGHGTTGGHQYITDPVYFGRSIRTLYDRFTGSLRQARNEIQSGGAAPNGAAAQEAVNSLKKKVNLLENKNRDLESLLKKFEENEEKDNDLNADQDKYIKGIRDQLKEFLALASPSLGAIDKLLTDLIKAQKKIPWATPFGADAEEIAKELARTKEALEKSEKARKDPTGRISELEETIKGLNTQLLAGNTNDSDELRRLKVELEERKGEHGLLRIEINRLKNENTRLTAENQSLQGQVRGGGDGRLNACEREREQLQKDNGRLQDENRRLQEQIAAGGGNTDPADQPQRYRDIVRGLEDDIKVLQKERQALRNTIQEQARVIDGNGEQADRTQAALTEQISVFQQAQLALMRDIENKNLNHVHQARLAAEWSRSLRFARGEADMFKTLIQALTVERDLLQDEVRLCVEAQQQARQRARESAEAGDGTRTVVVQRPGNFFVRTYTLFLTAIQYTAVWSIFLAVLGMMLAVIVAEGRRYAEWQEANQHSRALYMSLQSKPVLCLSPPTMDYFWNTVGLVLVGRWKTH